MPGRKKRGKGFFGDAWNKVKQAAKAVHQVAKDRKLVSGALKSMGHNNFADMAKKAGYGRKRRSRRGRGGVSLQMPGMSGVSVGWGRGGGVSETQKIILL